jgi:hypothetical protein
MKQNVKQILVGAVAVIVIAVSCVWIYRTQFDTAKYNVGLHQRVGEVLAEQTAGLIGKKGKIVAISIDTKEWPELRTQMDAFKAALKTLGDYELREYQLDTKDQPKYGVGSGLSGRRYVRTVKKNATADVFVSFVGVPALGDDELAELVNKPRLIAEARSPDNLSRCFTNQLLNVAVVSRFQFPSPGVREPNTPDEWFTKRFQVVTSATALPPAEAAR